MDVEASGGAMVFPKRCATLFMGNGINPKHWWAKSAGADMELSKSLEPLAPYKTRLNVISGLFNKNATGVGIHPGQTGNILSGAALQKGAVLKGATVVVVNQKTGVERPSATNDAVNCWLRIVTMSCSPAIDMARRRTTS